MNIIPRSLRSSGIQSGAAVAEKLLATIGGCLAILSIAAVSFRITGTVGAAAVVPSMGASAVLLFAVPHGPLSQPWALFVGHITSAIIGVTCALLIPNLLIAASCSVGLAIGAMHLTRSIHPPGGATALAAVIGGPAIYQLGYWYVLIPTLLNCLIIFAFAMVFNNLFPWRCYPVARMKFRQLSDATHSSIDKQVLQSTLQKHNIFISAQELLPAIEEAQLKSKHLPSTLNIELGGVYSNDRPGADWSVRKIIDEHPHSNPEKDIVIYTVLQGFDQKRRSASCRRYEFAHWAKKRLTPISS